MKRVLCITLAAIFFASVLTSCASPGSPRPALDPKITVTSSDAVDAAKWLDERLDSIPDRIVIGTDAAKYDVDVSALEDNGYIIRYIGNELAILARTADGLDIAARKYAKSVEAGKSIADETYHEGYRIKELRLAGNDISTYAISVEGEDDYICKWAKQNAAEPFAKLIKIACGAEIPIGGEAEHRIVFRRTTDKSFKESSYHYYFVGGDLIFEYADLAGARNCMVKFLENECGWDDLYYGFDVLRESDLVDVTAETDVLCHPRFGGIRLTTIGSFYEKNTLYSVGSDAFTYKYRIPSAHHYVGRIWAKEYGCGRTGHMPCLTDEDVIADTAEEIAASVAASIASNVKIGEELDCINLGMEDSGAWCSCKNCLKLAKEENYTWAGPMVYFANAIDDALDEMDYDGLKYSIFAYYGSNPPPKTSPHDDVYVTFVCDNYCTTHALNGSQCTGNTLNLPGTVGGTRRGNNNEEANWIRGWCEIAKHVYVRPAPLSAPFHAYTIIDQLYDDITFLTECGVECIYNEIYTTLELDTNLIATELWEAMTFDPDMTRAEYYEEVARLFEKYYGDGWQGAFDYIECLEATELATDDCWSAWHGYAFITDTLQNDHALYRKLWDRMLDSLSLAEKAANSDEQEDRVKRLRISALIGGCYASYYYAYEDRDDERIAMLCERWDEMIALSKEVGIYDEYDDIVKSLGLQYEAGSKLIYDSLEDTAWIGGWALGWYHDRKEMLGRAGYDMKNLRPAPEKYAKQ